MQYKSLGKSELKISGIGFGCMSLKKEEKENIQLLHTALEHGINYFDTADMYDKGQNEILVGKAFADRRDKVILATKVGNQWRADGSGWDWNPRKDYILREVENSLQRLRTDYIDLYQLHGGTIEDNIDETIEAFELLVQQGKIRYYGISSIRPNVIRQYVAKSNIVSVMMQYSLLDRRPEEMMLPYLKENNVGVLARGALASGLLMDKPAKEYLNYSKEEVASLATAVRQSSPADATTTAIQYVLDNLAVTAAVVGIRTQPQLEKAIRAVDAEKVGVDILEKLKNVLPPLLYEQHR